MSCSVLFSIPRPVGARRAAVLGAVPLLLACRSDELRAIHVEAVVAPPVGDAGAPPGLDAESTSHPDMDFSVFQKWHLCDPGDLEDCALQCRRGHLPSCVRLGNIYFDGKIVPRDLHRAAELYDLPCTFHIAAACFDRGAVYAREGDQTQAATYFSRACDGRMADGCYELARAYEAGQGVSRDTARAAALYRVACDGGHWGACSNLGVLTMNGDGVAVDEPAAARLFERACAAGNAEACGNLGSCYAAGQGYARDPARAARLYRQACDGGVKQYCRFSSGPDSR